VDDTKQKTQVSTIRLGKLVVNLQKRIVTVHGQPVQVTGKEYSILELLSLHKGTVLTKDMFRDHLYGGMDGPDLKSSTSLSASCAKSSLGRAGEIIT